MASNFHPDVPNIRQCGPDGRRNPYSAQRCAAAGLSRRACQGQRLSGRSVVQQVSGAREHIKDLCGWLAQQGYFAMSDPDDELAVFADCGAL
jgi:hypothetical protein